jgi:transposase
LTSSQCGSHTRRTSRWTSWSPNGISRGSLNRWRREYGEDPDQAFPRKGQQKERDAEVAQLKKALREAQLENEVLKQAVAIFTQPKR